MPIVYKSVSLNLLETSGPVQACNGIALPLPFTGFHVVTFVMEKEMSVYANMQNLSIKKINRKVRV